MKERDVVGVREFLRRRSGKLAEPDGQHGGAQRVLERLSRTQVGGEGEGANDLGGADRRLRDAGLSFDRAGIFAQDALLSVIAGLPDGMFCGVGDAMIAR